MVGKLGMMSLFVSCVALGTTHAWHMRFPDIHVDDIFDPQHWNVFNDHNFDAPFSFSKERPTSQYKGCCQKQRRSQMNEDKRNNVSPESYQSVDYHLSQVSKHEENLKEIKTKQENYRKELQRYQTYLQELAEHRSQIGSEISRVNEQSDKIQNQLRELLEQENQNVILITQEKELLNQASAKSEHEIFNKNYDDERERREKQKRLIEEKERELEMLKQQLHGNHDNEDKHYYHGNKHNHFHESNNYQHSHSDYENHHDNGYHSHGDEYQPFHSNENHNPHFGGPQDNKKDLDGDRKSDIQMPVIKTILNLSINGYNPSDLRVYTEDGVLFVKGRRECKCKASCRKREFEKSFTLPQGVDTRTLKATFDKNGTLKIRGLQSYEKTPQPDLGIRVSKLGHFDSNTSEQCPTESKIRPKLKKVKNVYKFKRPGNFANDDDSVTIEPIED